ncbi:MAG: Ketosteroid isomerase-related protein [Acidimicrobiia bacterium]|nr:Ketosteroid isomerase-related protein [Acidimicrobiia bacterium]
MSAAIDTMTVAEQYVASLAGGAGPRPEIFAAEVSLWWNTNPDGRTINGEEFAAALAAGHPTPGMEDYRLEVMSCRPMDSGFVVTLAVRGTTPEGEAVAAHVAQIVTVENGRIVRWEEFLDRGQHVPFHGDLATQ